MTQVEELRNDYKNVGSWEISNAEKKELAAKYGSPTNKAKDIQKMILLRLKELRKSRTDFTKDDIKDFTELNTNISVYNRFVEAISEEPVEFARFFFECIKNSLEEKGWDKYIKWSPAQIKNSVMRDRFRVESLVKNYNFLDKYLYSLTDQSKSEEQIFNELEEKMQKEMSGFKKAYLKNVEDDAKLYYNTIDKRIERLEKMLQELDDKLENIRKECTKNGSYWSYLDNYEYNENNKTLTTFKTMYNRAKFVKNHYTEEEYVEENIEKATDIFNSNVKSLTGRIIQKGLDVEKIELNGIGHDPKFFKMFITDGKQNLFARSVYAAEGSEKMVAHFRFIITSRKW